MAFTVKQMSGEPIILVTYRRNDTTFNEVMAEGTKIANLLREIGDYGYVILDLTGHKSSYQALYNTIQEALYTNAGKISNPAQSIVIIGSSELVEYYHQKCNDHLTEIVEWTVTTTLDHALQLIRTNIRTGEFPSPPA